MPFPRHWLIRHAAPWALLASLALPSQAEQLNVLHWWTSASERRAADLLAERAAAEQIVWRDAAIAGGAGVGAMKVLKSRILSGQAPDVTQLIGPAIAEWSELGLLLPLDEVAERDDWQNKLFPTIRQLVSPGGRSVAVPVGLHRINTLFYRSALLGKLGLKPPRNWDEFELLATKLKAGGFVPLAQSKEPWQVATLFEAILLGEAGPAGYRALFEAGNAAQWQGAPVARALERLRRLQRWMPQPLREQPWQAVAHGFARGEAVMWIMGDWAKGELLAMGQLADADFDCQASPATEDAHLYSVDTLAMLAGKDSQPAQLALAALVVNAPVQIAYNRIKGSVPVRRDINPAQLDACGRASWQTFARGSGVQAPSIVHRMATGETLKEAITAQVHRYFLDKRLSTAETQRKLAGYARALGRQ
ncbi:ABC transporter substrate-binding protein [Chitinimonas taiwanensis]|uniref:Probable sugar-binding periplasmic protein n=1 Tax=Chitinimonas taiwanensis DSM 18899 TaxID=1121279 RepID=A0A1K2H7B1_9NEIS|nr:ABC transporter substrate-binding protein [Chitinimonas taiwanensis]SFZ72343.1 glucose/mannose transport system substrate-binding protein [Chitinimonas taiwanensis DSM 18899]